MDGLSNVQQSMNSVEVIRKALEPQIQAGLNFEEFLKKLSVLVKKPDYRLLQIGNTVFILHKTSNDTNEVKILNAAPPQQLLESIKALIKVMKNANVKHIVGYSDSPEYLELAQQSGLPVKIGKSKKPVGEEKKEVYTFKLDIE